MYRVSLENTCWLLLGKHVASYNLTSVEFNPKCPFKEFLTLLKDSVPIKKLIYLNSLIFINSISKDSIGETNTHFMKT